MVISVILIQHFLGILCATEFRATQIFKKFHFLATWASQYYHQQIPGNSMVKNIFATKIHGESYPVSMPLLVMYLMTQYFHTNFPVNALLAKLPNTSTRGFLSA